METGRPWRATVTTSSMLRPPGVRTTGLAETVRECDERAVRLLRAMGGSLGSGGRQIERACKSQRTWVGGVPAEHAGGWHCSVQTMRMAAAAPSATEAFGRLRGRCCGTRSGQQGVGGRWNGEKSPFRVTSYNVCYVKQKAARMLTGLQTGHGRPGGCVPWPWRRLGHLPEGRPGIGLGVWPGVLRAVGDQQPAWRRCGCSRPLWRR